MLGIVLVAALGALLLVLLLMPVRLTLAIEGHGVRLSVRVAVAALFWRMQREIDVAHKVGDAIERNIACWFDREEKAAEPTHKAKECTPVDHLLRVAKPPLRRLLWRSHCRQLQIGIRIGGRDAMESALLAGASWALIGAVLGLASQWIHLPAAEQRVAVVPEFQRPLLGMDVACIVQFRLGQAIATTIWLLSRSLGDPEVRAWLRDRRRRERGRQDERASDSGPDEDGHGEPQRDG